MKERANLRGKQQERDLDEGEDDKQQMSYEMQMGSFIDDIKRAQCSTKGPA